MNAAATRQSKNAKRDITTAKSETPDLDLSGVTVSVAPVAAVKKTQSSKYDNSPINGWLAESFKDGQARQVTIKAEQVVPFKTAVRACAARLHIGHRFGDDVTNEDGTVTVTFLGKKPRQVKGQTEVPNSTQG